MLRVSAAQAMIAASAAGVTVFQYRSKKSSRKEVYEMCVVLARYAKQAGSLFIVNDYADIALAADADGVHLGQDDLPLDDARKILGSDKIIGISTHSKEQAVAAEKGGADYIGFGPIFETSTKNAGNTQGISGIITVREAVSIPIIAIGGINQVNVRKVMRAGADGIAVISAILSAHDIQQAAGRMIRMIYGSKCSDDKLA